MSALLESCGVHVPQVLAADTALGYALLEDLGTTHMLTALSCGGDAVRLYDEALAELAQLQLRGAAPARALPPYDHATLLREMQLLPDWYCRRHLGFEPTWPSSRCWRAPSTGWRKPHSRSRRCSCIATYHSRNLMVMRERSPGVIDFQDALRGPVGYDLASILKDCYIDWPRARVVQWVAQYRAQLLAGGAEGQALAGASDAQFLGWFDAIGLQRHIKVLGIFARLFWRDGKTGYLADLPRTLAYVQEAAPPVSGAHGLRRFRGHASCTGLVGGERARAGAGGGGRQVKVMLLAAGRGERMRPLTDQCPKPLLPVAGQPLIAWHLQRLAAAGFTEVVINLSWLGEQIERALVMVRATACPSPTDREPWPALETGGGIFNALPLLGSGPFLLVNGDVFTDIDFGALRLAPDDLGQLVLVPNPGHNLKGDFWLEAGRVVEAGGARLTYSGIALLRPELLAGAPGGRFPLLPWLNRAREAGRLGGQQHAGRWLDIGTPERLAQVDAELQGMRG